MHVDLRLRAIESRAPCRSQCIGRTSPAFADAGAGVRLGYRFGHCALRERLRLLRSRHVGVSPSRREKSAFQAVYSIATSPNRQWYQRKRHDQHRASQRMATLTSRATRLLASPPLARPRRPRFFSPSVAASAQWEDLSHRQQATSRRPFKEREPGRPGVGACSIAGGNHRSEACS